MRSLIPISEIANTICEDGGDVTKKHQKMVLRNLARCYQELHLYMTPFTTVKTEIFPVSNSIEMPADFVYETKVGVKVDDRIVFVGKNYDKVGNIENDMTQTQFTEYVIDTLNPDIDRSVTPFYNYRGDLIISAYGNGGKCDGLYEVDYINGRILLGSNVPRGCELVVEYKSDGISHGLDLVPTEMEPVLYNYGMKHFYLRKADPRFRVYDDAYEGARYQLESLYKFKPIDYISKLYNTDKGTINNFI